MDKEGALGTLKTGKKTLEQIVDYDKYLQWNRHNRVQIVWKVIQKSEEKNENIISSNLTRLQINTRETSHISSHGNQGEKEEARLRDFHIGYW